MARTGPETRLQRRIQKELKREFGLTDLYIFKVHGGMYQQPGIPDLVGCLKGMFFGLEVKHPDTGHDLTTHQAVNLDKINAAGGCQAVVESPEAAVEILRDALYTRGLLDE